MPSTGAQQMKVWAVCQLCGEATLRRKAKGWLISPYRKELTIDIIRCPRHISEWALRQCIAGRTKEMRKMMAEGRKQPAPPIKPINSPMPLSDTDPADNLATKWDY